MHAAELYREGWKRQGCTVGAGQQQFMPSQPAGAEDIVEAKATRAKKRRQVHRGGSNGGCAIGKREKD